MHSFLEPSKAFEQGHVLWIIPHDSTSYWYQRLNWLTNFRLTANELHSRPQMHPSLIKILEACEIKTPEIPISEPLLIPVAQWLPADWLIMLPIASSNEVEFVTRLKTIWEQFQQPSLRVFVPRGFMLKKVESLLVEKNLTGEISLVVEPE